MKGTFFQNNLIPNMIILLSVVVLFSSFSFAFAVTPGAPHLWKADAEDKVAKLEWVPADRGIESLTHYIVEYRPNTTSNWKSIQADFPYLTVTGLTNGVLYEFRVISVNEDGEGNPSNIISSRPTKYDVAGPPQNIQTATDHNTAKLRWDVPYKRYPLPFQYDVRYKPVVDNNWVLDRDGDRITTSTVITGLEPGIVYEFQIRSINHAGNGPWSSSVTANVPNTLSSAPTNLIATTSFGKVELSWMAPTYTFSYRECSGYCRDVPNFLPPWNPHTECVGSCKTIINHLDDSTITDYKIMYKTNNSNWLEFDDGKNTKTTATVTGLVRGDSYSFRVSATNSIGTSAPSNIVSLTVKGPPDAPEITRVEPTHNSIHVWWSKPNMGSSPIKDYILQYKSTSAWITYKDGTGTSTNVKATNLKPNTLYQLRVIAVNSEGRSEPSSIVTVSTSEHGVPSQPINLNIVNGINQVELNWDVPHKRNPSISDYIIEYRNDNNSWVTFNDGKNTNLSIIITGLTGGIEYEFRVTAVNSEGNSEPSSIATATPGPYPPGIPTNIQIKTTNKQVTLTWDPPTSDGDSPITHYIIKYRLISSWSMEAQLTTTNTSITITDLDNSVYFFKISAVNAIGEGESSKTMPIYPSCPKGQLRCPL